MHQGQQAVEKGQPHRKKGFAATFPLISVSATAVSATGGGLGSWDWTERREGNLCGPHHEYSHQHQLTHSISEPSRPQMTLNFAEETQPQNMIHFQKCATKNCHVELPPARFLSSTVPQQPAMTML